MTRHIEDFSFFNDAGGIGSPFLMMRKWKKSGEITWGDGTLFRYYEFNKYLRSSSLESDIKEIWQKCLKSGSLSRKSYLGMSPTRGFMKYIPKEAAEQAFAIISKHYVDALKAMISAGDCAPGPHWVRRIRRIKGKQ